MAENIPDFVVFDGRDIAKVVFAVKQLRQPRRLHLNEMRALASALETFLQEGVEVTAEQLRKGTK